MKIFDDVEKKLAKPPRKKRPELPAFSRSKARTLPYFYLAYGSNLNIGQMRRRCPLSEPLRKIVLEDVGLVFRGVADIEAVAGAKLQAGLWTITDQCEMALDIYEGYNKDKPSSGLYDKTFLELANGMRVMTYFMNRGRVGPPTRFYYEVIAEGYKNFGLDKRFLDEAVSNAFMSMPVKRSGSRT